MFLNNTVKNFYQLFHKNSSVVFACICFSTIILRLPSVIIDFIHVDVLTSYLLAKRDLLGLSYSMNKGWLYHQLMKFSINYIADTPSSFHFIGLLFILMTMYGIYILAKKIYDSKTGLFAAFLYGTVISCYHTEYLACNGEIFYNLFNVFALYCYYVCVFEKKRIYIVLLVINIVASYLIKFQGIFILPIILTHFIFIYPLSFNNNDYRRFYKNLFIVIAIGLVTVATFLIIGYVYFGFDFINFIYMAIMGKYTYVANRGFNIFSVLIKLLWRVYQFSIFHAFFWYPGIILIAKFIHDFKNKKIDYKTLFILYVSVCFFILVFSGLGRLSVHYFIPIMPSIAILSSKQILYVFSERGKRIVFMQLMFTIVFFFAWHYKDLYIYTCNPNLKHNESRLTEIFRIAIIGSYGEYLLPHKSLLPAIEYINKNYPDSTMLIWPMGTEIDYFTTGESVIPSYWLNERALYAVVQREKGNEQYIHEYENYIIQLIIQYKPDLFVDVGSTDMIKKVMVYRKKGDPLFYFNIHATPIIHFGHFASLDDFPGIICYLNEHYTFNGYFGKSRIWIKK